MISKSMKKVLSSIVIATYLVIYVAPVGMCVSVTSPQIDAGVEKPVLRGASQPSALKLEGDIAISKNNPKISLSLRDSDVKQVLRMFADKAGLNIIFHSSVDTPDTGAPGANSSPASSNGGSSAARKVTLDLVNVPLNDAFKMVLQVTNLTYYIENNTIIVASANAAQKLNLAKQEIMTIPVKYADAAVLADFLDKNIFSLNKPGLSNANVAITNPGTNEILIFGTKNDYLMAKKVVEQFDKKPLDETFIVNHTTPKEMSDLICQTLFKSFISANSKDGSSSNSGSPGGTSPSKPTGGAAPIHNDGVLTGAAASSGSSSSSSSSSGGGSSDGDLSLGRGVIACQYNNSIGADQLSSLRVNNLTITYFPERGTISVMGGSEQQMEMIKEFITKNDKKQPQAFLDVSIIELNETGTREFDNTWQVWSEFFSGSFDGATKTNPLYPNFFGGDSYTLVDTSGTTPTPLYTLSKFTGSPMATYTMNYVIKNGKGRVLANPRIMITNGKESKIDLSSDYVKTVTSQVLNSNGITGATQKTYEIGNDEGITVSMTPFISPDGYVTLDLTPNYSTEKGQVTEYNSTTKQNDLVATLLQRRNLDLKNIRIKDGETLVIGGMIRESETKTIAKVPVLGDLPGVGMFFRNSTSAKEKQELVIMITPKIIKDSEDVVSNPSVTL